MTTKRLWSSWETKEHNSAGDSYTVKPLLSGNHIKKAVLKVPIFSSGIYCKKYLYLMDTSTLLGGQ